MEMTTAQRFVIETVKRSEIKEHPSNPRVISTAAEKRLKDKMDQVGLLQPLVVSKRTMHLLSGHQRLKQIDKHEKYNRDTGKNDYQMQVSMADVTAEVELEMLVFFNNPSAMGEWNLDGIAKMNLVDGITFSGMGFDKVDASLMFEGDPRFSDMFAEPQVIKNVAQQAAEIAAIKESKKDARGRFVEINNTDFYFVVVCSSSEEKSAVMAALGQPIWEQVCSADAIVATLEKAGVKVSIKEAESDDPAHDKDQAPPSKDASAPESDQKEPKKNTPAKSRKKKA